MDADGFPLAAISEKSNETSEETPKRRANKGRRQTSTPTSEHSANLENGDAASTGRKRNKTKPPLENNVSSEPTTTIELNEVTDDDDGEPERERRLDAPARVSTISPEPGTMISSYTTGGENDVIEIHQFSPADLDVYLDIYFETLNSRLRHYVGGNEQLTQFRTSMKNRIGKEATKSSFRMVFISVVFQLRTRRRASIRTFFWAK